MKSDFSQRYSLCEICGALGLLGRGVPEGSDAISRCAELEDGRKMERGVEMKTQNLMRRGTRLKAINEKGLTHVRKYAVQGP
jgi:hypothetical protein